MLITQFEANYNRIGKIELKQETCDKCFEEKIVITIDSSQEEYGAGKICRSCIKTAYDDFYKLNEAVEPIECPLLNVSDLNGRRDSDINLNEQ